MVQVNTQSYSDDTRTSPYQHVLSIGRCLESQHGDVILLWHVPFYFRNFVIFFFLVTSLDQTQTSTDNRPLRFRLKDEDNTRSMLSLVVAFGHTP